MTRDILMQDAATMRENLLCRLAMLEDVTRDSGNMAALQRIATRLTAINKSPPIPESLAMSSFALDLDSFPPANLDSYSDDLLVRISGMSIGDAVKIYRGLVFKCNASIRDNLVFSQAYSQFLNFSALCLMIPSQKTFFTLNLETGNEEEPSDNWYRVNSMLIPANGQYADLCTNLMAYMAHLSRDPTKQLSQLTTIQEVSSALQRFMASSNDASFVIDLETEESIKRQMEMDSVLNRFLSITRSMLSLRSLLTLYMASQMIHIIGSEVCASLGRSVWPFAVPRGMRIVDFYLERPEVQAAMSEFRSSRVMSSTLASLNGPTALPPGTDNKSMSRACPTPNAYAGDSEPLALLKRLSHSKPDEKSGTDLHKVESPADAEWPEDRDMPLESTIVNILAPKDGNILSSTMRDVAVAHPLSEPVGQVMQSSPDAPPGLNPGLSPGWDSAHPHDPLMIQSDLPIEDVLLLACNHAWGT